MTMNTTLLDDSIMDSRYKGELAVRLKIGSLSIADIFQFGVLRFDLSSFKRLKEIASEIGMQATLSAGSLLWDWANDNTHVKRTISKDLVSLFPGMLNYEQWATEFEQEFLKLFPMPPSEFLRRGLVAEALLTFILKNPIPSGLRKGDAKTFKPVTKAHLAELDRVFKFE